MTAYGEETPTTRLLSQAELRGLQILTFAFMGGIAFFLGTVVLLYFTSTGPKGAHGEEAGVLYLQVLSIANAATFISCFAAGSFLFKLKLARIKKAISEESQATPMQQPGLSQKFREAFILRLALLEGPGLFGGVICLTGIGVGEIHHHPIYWLNLLAPVVAMAWMGVVLPTKEKLPRLFSDEGQTLYR